MGYPDTPTLDKIQEVQEKSRTIGDFLEWLKNERGNIICKLVGDECLWDQTTRTESLLYEYFGIDERAAEEERRALLDHIQSET